jgi:hypothetical protein
MGFSTLLPRRPSDKISATVGLIPDGIVGPRTWATWVPRFPAYEEAARAFSVRSITGGLTLPKTKGQLAMKAFVFVPLSSVLVTVWPFNAFVRERCAPEPLADFSFASVLRGR